MLGLFKRSSVGMEIDSKEIRVVYLEGSAEKPVPRIFARHPLPQGLVRDGKVQNPAELGAAISALWAKENIRCKDVILGINNQDVIIRFALVPDLPKDKLHNLIHYQSTEYIPIPIQEIELDYSVVGSVDNASGKLLKLLLVAGRKQMLFDFVNALEQAHLNITDISVSMLSIIRLIPAQFRERPVVLLNLSNDFGNIVIMNRNEPGMARTFSYPSNLLPYLSGLLGVNGYEGREFREEALVRVSDYLTGEIRSSVQYYRNMEPDVTFENILLTGSIAKAEGLISQMQPMVNTKLDLFNLGDLEYCIPQHKDGSPQGPDYAVCLSLAIRGLEV